jgi:hypothetical protein
VLEKSLGAKVSPLISTLHPYGCNAICVSINSVEHPIYITKYGTYSTAQNMRKMYVLEITWGKETLESTNINFQ